MLAWTLRHQPELSYPLTVGLTLILFGTLLNLGFPPMPAAYLPVLLAAAAITWLETRFPHQQDWRPDATAIRQDLAYMAVVQVAVPKLLSLGAVLLAAEQVRHATAPSTGLWPHHWPLAAQAAVMVLSADFLRYWLHLAAHKHPLLWRLHAVHHSPQRLYWLNVGRFHPLEKALQFLLDSLPFVLLGVAPEVIALYFVFYAVNGFFQHSNVQLRHGPLNYLVSSAELHRWHHSRLSGESNHNYGNNLIVWDLLFGTRYLPDGRDVAELGLMNRRYPMRFGSQLLTPFAADPLDKTQGDWTPGRIAGRWAFLTRMNWLRITAWRRLQTALQTPEQTQHTVLKRILDANRDTTFGRDHCFADIHNHADFVASVPVQDYESLRPYIESQEASGEPVLTTDQPVMYAVTSGTAGEPKYLPVLPDTLRQYREEQALFTCVMHRHFPRAFAGRILTLASPGIEGHRPSGLPYGSVSGHLNERIPALLRQNRVVPPTVFGMRDAALKYRVIARLALQEPGITYLGGANASSFLQLLDVIGTHREALAKSLEQASLDPLGDVPLDLAQKLSPLLRADAATAHRLRRTPPGHRFSFADFWPDIQLATVWTGGSCGVAVSALQERLPATSHVVELGYLASEFRGTITLDPVTGAGAPTLQHHFFEFIEPMDWDSGEQEYRLLHELQPGREYFVVITTGSGLYRYFMNDIVRTVGLAGSTPTLRFVQKGRGTTSITGEKLYEGQVLQAVQEACEQHSIGRVFVMTLADTANRRYDIYLEAATNPPPPDSAIAAQIDRRLGELNIEYRAKRDSHRLEPLRLHWLRSGAGAAYKHSRLALGQREGQFKTIALQARETFDFDLDAWRHPQAGTTG